MNNIHGRNSTLYEQKRLFASERRNNPTAAEAAAWDILRSGHTGFKFRRQVNILGWIVNFYCPKLKLVLEVNGRVLTDATAVARQHHRDQSISGAGLAVMRFPCEDVVRNPSMLHRHIREYASLAAKVRS